MSKETLTVKNFGPIREAYLDLRKVTVLIGEQASGKSVLAKLVAIFRNVQFVVSSDTSEWFDRFSIYQYLDPHTIIRYECDFYVINITDEEIQVLNVKEQLALLNKIQAHREKFKGPYNASGEHLNILQEANLQLRAIEEEIRVNGQDAVYIPAERHLIPLIAEANFSLQLNQIALPRYLLMFGSDYEKSRKKITSFEAKRLNIKYSCQGFSDMVEFNRTTTKLSESATGLQSVVPLMLVVENCSQDEFVVKSNFRFIIEEPELNLYPTTQKLLLEYLIEKCTKGDNRLILTTHSPYILAALNNCIQADNVKREYPEDAPKADQLVRPESQIAYEDVMAYYVADGTAKAIMNEEYRLIDANALDDVSNEIDRIFDQLLDLKYQHQE